MTFTPSIIELISATSTSVRARRFLIVDDHSRLIVDGRFFAHENTRAGRLFE